MSTQPTFCLHNGQIMLINNNTHKQHEGNWKDFLAEGDDGLSCTSSNMSDEDSWTTDDDESSFDGEDDEHDVLMDASCATNNMTQSNLISARANRSTVSLSASFAVQEPIKTSQQPRQPASLLNLMELAKAKSLQDLTASANGPNAEGNRRPPPMTAIQRVSAQDCLPGSEQDNAMAVQPDDHLGNILETQLDRVPYDSLGDYFLKPTPEHIAAWDHDLLKAIRTQDLPLLQRMHQQDGKPLQASNQFGESIVHVCVRRGNSAILRYLLEQGVSPRVHCDYGRTPLHDALWTMTNPESLRMAAMIISKCPEMLLVTDKRGFTPLNYVPRDRWADCCRFLDRCVPLLMRLKNNGRTSSLVGQAA